MESLTLRMKMNAARLVRSKESPREAMVPNLFAALRNPSAACGEALASCSLTFAIKATGGRIEEVVHAPYILWTGVL
jgi:hypothetical protein